MYSGLRHSLFPCVAPLHKHPIDGHVIDPPSQQIRAHRVWHVLSPIIHRVGLVNSRKVGHSMLQEWSDRWQCSWSPQLFRAPVSLLHLAACKQTRTASITSISLVKYYVRVSRWESYTSARLDIDLSEHQRLLSHPQKRLWSSASREALPYDRIPAKGAKLRFPGFENLLIKSFTRAMLFWSGLTVAFLHDSKCLSSGTILSRDRGGMWLVIFVKPEWPFAIPALHCSPLAGASQGRAGLSPKWIAQSATDTWYRRFTRGSIW